MKIYKNFSIINLKAIIMLSVLLIASPITPMSRALSMQTPEQRRAMAAKQAAFRKEMAAKQTILRDLQRQEETTKLISSMVPRDIQKYDMIPRIMDPAINYLKTEIIKKNTLQPTVLSGHPAKITNAEFSKNGKIVVTSSEGEQDNLIIWNVTTAKKLQTISVPNGNVEIVVPSSNGNKVISVSTIVTQKNDSADKPDIEESTLILWDGITGQQIKTLDLPAKYIHELEFSSDGKRIIVTGAPAKIITDTNMNDPESKAYIYIADANTGDTIAIDEIINDFPGVTINPNGNTAVVRSDTDLILYDLNTGKAIQKLNGPTERIYNAQYSADGKKVIASDPTAQTIFIWNGQTGDLLQQFDNLVSYSVALNSDGTKMLTTDGDNHSISLWDIASNAITNTFIVQQDQIYSVQFSPDDSMIAAVAQDNNIMLWNANNSEQILTTSGDGITFSSDSKRIQIHTGPEEGEEKCTVVLWNIAAKKEIRTFIAKHDLFEVSEDFLNAIAPDDTNDHNFILWTPFTPEERTALAKIRQDITIEQAQYIHNLYTAKLSMAPNLITDHTEFDSLPADVQALITEYLRTPQRPSILPFLRKTRP